MILDGCTENDVTDALERWARIVPNHLPVPIVDAANWFENSSGRALELIGPSEVWFVFSGEAHHVRRDESSGWRLDEYALRYLFRSHLVELT